MMVRVRDEGGPFRENYTIKHEQTPGMEPITNSYFFVCTALKLPFSTLLACLLSFWFSHWEDIKL